MVVLRTSVLLIYFVSVVNLLTAMVAGGGLIHFTNTGNYSLDNGNLCPWRPFLEAAAAMLPWSCSAPTVSRRFAQIRKPGKTRSQPRKRSSSSSSGSATTTCSTARTPSSSSSTPRGLELLHSCSETSLHGESSIHGDPPVFNDFILSCGVVEVASLDCPTSARRARAAGWPTRRPSSCLRPPLGCRSRVRNVRRDPSLAKSRRVEAFSVRNRNIVVGASVGSAPATCAPCGGACRFQLPIEDACYPSWMAWLGVKALYVAHSGPLPQCGLRRHAKQPTVLM